jgi:predicted glycosyltransferase involved in capsule biosynthesis
MSLEYISIIIPTYNRVSLLPRAIESALKQTYKNYEIIIIDDGSSDETRELVKSYQGVKYFYQENKGPASARNLGISHAEHELIAFLDSDDWFAPDKLEKQLKIMAENPEYDLSHTQEVWYRRGIHLNQKAKHKKKGGDIFAQSLKLCAISMSTVVIRRKLFSKTGLFDESFPCCEDYDYWLRVTADQQVLLIDLPLTLKDGGRPDQLSCQYMVGMDKFRIKSLKSLIENGNLNLNKFELAKKELARKCRIYGNGCLKHGRPKEAEYYLSLYKKMR